MATSLRALCTYDIGSSSTSLDYVLRMASHIHIQDAICMELFHDMLGSHSDRGNEEFCLSLDNDIDQFVQVSPCQIDLCPVLSASSLK